MEPDPEAPASRRRADSPSKRQSVTFRPRDLERLAELEDNSDLNRNDLIRRAIAADWYLQRQRRAGRKILIENEDGTFREVEFLD